MNPDPESRFLFFSDAHIECGNDGTPQFEQQPRHKELIGPLFQGLSEAVQKHHVDLTLCGGDITDTGSTEEIEDAKKILDQWASPLALCLGNHDLGFEDSLSQWKSTMGKGITLADSVVDAGSWKVILLNTAWELQGRKGWVWNRHDSPKETLFPSQLTWLDQELTRFRNQPVILVVHAPAHSLPCELTGENIPLHVPDSSYASSLNALLDQHPQVKLVLSGHNHVTCAEHHGSRVHLSVSSISEPPFEYGLIQVTKNSLKLTMMPAIPMTSSTRYRPEKKWVNGRPSDREFQITWSLP